MDALSAYPFAAHQWIVAGIAALCLGMSKTGFTGMSMLTLFLCVLVALCEIRSDVLDRI